MYFFNFFGHFRGLKSEIRHFSPIFISAGNLILFGKGQNRSILTPKNHSLHQKDNLGQFFFENIDFGPVMKLKLALSISIPSRVTVQKGIKKGQHF